MSSQDVIQALGLKQLGHASPDILAADAEEAAIIGLMYQGVSDSAQLLERCGMKPSLFNQTMTMLEITGKIRPLGAGHYGLNQA